MRNRMPVTSAVWLILMICHCCVTPRLLHAEQAGMTGQNRSFPVQRLRIRAWVEPGPTVVTTRQVRYIIEISTPTWFTEGTHVKPLELADAVVKQAGQFATNFVQNEKGNTWSVQQWTFFIYPMKEKTYRIPELPVEVSIADPQGENPLSGEVRTPPVRFSAVIPEELKNIKNWVVTSRLTVREHYSVQSDTYEVGDAIERRIDIKADDLPAMMLPVFTDRAVPGFAVYEDPPKIMDDVNRGQITGRRVERITYFVEKPGTYRIPARIYPWFNTNTGQIEKIELPEKIIQTHGVNAPLSHTEPPASEKFFPVVLILTVAAGLFSIIILFLSWYRKNKTRSVLKPSSSALKRALKKAVKNGNKEEVTRIIYQWFDHYGRADGSYTHWRQLLNSKGTPEELRLFNYCMLIFYGPDTAAEPQAMPSARKLAGLMNRRFFKRRGLKTNTVSKKMEKIEELVLI